MKKKEDDYKEYIKALKGIKDDTTAQNEYIKIKTKPEFGGIEDKLLEVQGGGSVSGGRKTRKRINHRRRHNSKGKRFLLNLNKTLRRAKKYRRRKYTR